MGISPFGVELVPSLEIPPRRAFLCQFLKFQYIAKPLRTLALYCLFSIISMPGSLGFVVLFVVEVLTIPAIFLACGTNKVVWRRKGSHFEILRIRVS